jgi:hypothetical protein
MTKDEALDLALEVMRNQGDVGVDEWIAAEAAIKQARSAPVQEPVAWPCVIAEADFEKNTVTLEMQCSDYKVGAGRHWLHTTPPKQPAVPDAFGTREGEHPQYIQGWNDCRQAMMEMKK